MPEPRLPTHLWVEAKIRSFSDFGHSVFVLHKGDLTGGTVLFKLFDGRSDCRVLIQQRDMAGVLTWFDALTPGVADEKTADEYIRRALFVDPDMWAIEVMVPQLQIDL